MAVLVWGCGGGGTNPSPPPPPPPPPAPVVTSVEVSPLTGPLFITDTLQLTATVKDQNGAVMTGKTVTWSSSNATLATVSSSGLVIGVGAGAVTISALVDARTGTAQLTVSDPGPRITTETATAATGTIGVEGGSITTTSTGGVVYTLVVPAGALAAPTLIHLTPVTAVRKLPLSGGLVGGVEFQPSGLRFATPARLRVAILQRPPAGMRLLGLTADGDASVLLPQPALDSGTVASLPILHFSNGLVGFGTTADVSSLLANTGGVTTAGQHYTNQIMQLTSATPLDVAAITQAMKDWFHNVILPLFQNATTDVQLTAAVSEYNWWNLDAPLALGIPSPQGQPGTYAAELAALAPVAAGRIGGAVDGNNVACRNQQSFSALANVLFWQTQAQALGVATVAFNLDRASVLAGLCAQVALESSVLPDPMDVGTPYSLDATFGVQFLANGSPQGAPFGVTLTAAALSIAHPTGATNISGFYTTVVSPTSPGPLLVSARGCLILPGTSAPSDVCGSGTVQSNGRGVCGRIVAGPVSINNDADAIANFDVKQAGSVTIQGTFARPVVLDCLQQVTGSFTMAGVTTTVSLAALATVGGSLSIDPTRLDGMTVLTLPALSRVDGTLSLQGSRAASVTTPLQVQLPALTALGNDFSISSIRKLDLVLGSVTVPSTLDFDGPGLRSIQAGALTSGFVINFGPADDLVSISVGPLNAEIINIGPLKNTTSVVTGTVAAGTFNIGPTTSLPSFTIGVVNISDVMNVGPNQELTSLNGGGGVITGPLNIGPNPKLSTAVATAWAALFSAQRKNIGGNKIP